LQKALSLPPADRASVAALEESLLAAHAVNADSFDAIGNAELKRRSAAYKSGQAAARPAADVMADLRHTQTLCHSD
jgi:hypothetical protein